MVGGTPRRFADGSGDGTAPRVAWVSQLMTVAAKDWHQLIQNQRTAPSMLANSAR